MLRILKMHCENKRIFIGNLPPNTNAEELKKKLQNYGEVLSVELKKRHESSKFAFVDLKINTRDLNSCFDGLKQQEWQGYNVTLELARESFLTRLQREREQQQLIVSAVDPPGGAANKEDMPHKGLLNMFGGTKRALGDSPTENKSVAKDHEVLHRLESYSDVWRDDHHPGLSSSLQKNHDNVLTPETSLKLNKKLVQKPVNNGKTSEKILVNNCSLSEQKRLKSLDEKKRIYNEQKKLVRSALASVDGKPTLNKRIVFNSDDSNGDSQEAFNHAERTVAITALFDDDSADEHNFSINYHFEGEKDHKLLDLQSRFGNDERFKLDERFRDTDNEQPQQNAQLSEQDEDERLQNLKILGSVLGHEISLPDKKKHKHVSKPMLRFDPTKPDHMKYEIKKSETLVANGAVEKKKISSEVKPEASVKVSKEKFYKVSESLTMSFQKTADNESFSLRKMFGSDDDEVKEDSDYHYEPKVDSQGKKKIWKSQNLFKYDSSDQEEDGTNSFKHTTKLPSISQEPPKSEVQLVQGNTFFFLPDDMKLKEGVDFFNHKRNNEKTNEHFSEYRRNLKRWVKMKIKNNKHAVNKKPGKYSLNRKMKKVRKKRN